MATVERIIVLPVRDNDGVSLAREVASIKRAILVIAGGYSETKQNGVWLDDGKVYRDSAWRVSIVTDDATDAQIVDCLPAWCEQLRQICLFTTCASVTSDFVYASQEKATA